jgi:hypothetical protein
MLRSFNKALLFINSIFALGATAVLAAQDTSATLTGSVRAWGDGAIPGVDVELRLEDSAHTLFSVRAEDNGEFKFTVLPTGTFTLRLTSNGFRTLKLKLIHLASGERKVLPQLRLDVSVSDGGGPPLLDRLELAAGERAGNLNGRVENIQERPVNHAMVQLFCGEKSCGDTKTDANGEFIFFNLAPRDDYAIRVTRAGYLPWQGNEYEIQAGYDATYGSIVLRDRH